jgi:hypothetical protein
VHRIFWYYGVSVIGIGMIVFTWLNKKNIPAISLISFLIMGLLIIGEFFILTVFGAYAYKPEVFTDYFADDLVAYVLGNYFVWAGAANLVVNFSLGNRWIFLLASFFMLIETLFLNLGIFELHWWRTYMTGISVLQGMNLIKIWIAKLNEKPYKKVLRYMTFYVLAILFIHAPTYILLLTGKQHYSEGWDEDFYRDSSLFALPYHVVIAFIYVYFGCVLKKGVRLVPILSFLLSDFILVKMGILIFADQWNLFYQAIFRIINFMIFILYKNYVCRRFLATNE